ncbi:MAG: 2-amino-4-hydroxy-6-hydroxymethyldihydropteridine diphosphokinase [Chitinophagaceae bacterium]
MNTAYLLTGGNLGAREETLARAYKRIQEQCGDITGLSSLYETEAWGQIHQPQFLNQVLEIQTICNPQHLLEKLQDIEKQTGRIRKEKYGPRLIDIDILLFNDEIHDMPRLKIPHPEIQNRQFVLVPLAEIAPTRIHPILKKTITELLIICPDNLKVSKFY